MIEINLLPWRQNQRKNREQLWKIIASLFLSFLLILLWEIQHKTILTSQPKKINKPPITYSNNITPNVEFSIRNDLNSSKEKIFNASFFQIKFVGSFSSRKKSFALIELPTGETFYIQTGDEIGSEHGKVYRIDEKYLQVKIHNQIIRKELTYA